MTTTTRLTVADLKRAAKAAGATVANDSSGEWSVYQVYTLPGKCWDGNLHMLRVEWMNGDADWRHNAIADALERMMAYAPLSDCDNPECDYCHPEE